MRAGVKKKPPRQKPQIKKRVVRVFLLEHLNLPAINNISLLEHLILPAKYMIISFTAPLLASQSTDTL